MGDDIDAISRSQVDPSAFGEVFERHFDAIYDYLGRRIGGGEAEDLASETFVRAFAARNRYDPKSGTPRAWLFGIATNLVRQYWREEERRLRAYARSCFASVETDPGDVITRADARRQAGALADALASLPKGDRDVLLLHAWGELSNGEIAAALGLGASTVGSRLSRARAHVRGRIAPIGEVQDEKRR